MSRSRARVAALSAAALGLVVVGCLAVSAVAVGSPAVSAVATGSTALALTTPPADPPRVTPGLFPVTTPPAPAPSALAAAARAAVAADPAPVCATTRAVAPGDVPLRATSVTSRDSRQGCPQSRGIPTAGPPWGP
ncbi:hypothetical protein [Pseudonocardia xishanensis]|uniref:Uncharacterized protein n=1 Tax=Pseudonocardia xishanensis TaxID=630995 RepID=A0ABP8RW10_9PSEU